MDHKNLFAPLIKTLDKIILGIEEPNQIDKPNEFIEVDTEEEFDVERSMN